MNRLLICLVILFCLSSLGLARDPMVLKENDSFDFLKKMNANDVYVKWVWAVDVDSTGNLYFLDKRYCHILKIETDTGKLITSISSKGQGPQEIFIAETMTLKDDKIYVVQKVVDVVVGELALNASPRVVLVVLAVVPWAQVHGAM